MKKMTDIVIFDIDGTLTNIEHRLCYIKDPREPNSTAGWRPDWDAFHAACVDDAPIPEIVAVARALHEAGHVLFAVSGRMDTVRCQTRAWLETQRIFFDALYMRIEGDYRPDYEVKREFLWAIRAAGCNPILAFDDRQQVVDMWRSEGVRCCQVAPGNF